MSYISRWLLLVSVILQIPNLEAILYSGNFFWYTLYPKDVKAKTVIFSTTKSSSQYFFFLASVVNFRLSLAW